MTSETTAAAPPREISVRIQLNGGHSHTLTLREDAAELRDLFVALNDPAAIQGLVQLPLADGNGAWSFRPSQLVSVITEPPVLIVPEANAGNTPTAAHLRPSRHLILDDFLSPDEHRDMYFYALGRKAEFSPGSVTSNDPVYRQNLVILDFGSSPHGKLLANRLLTWFPLLAQAFGVPVFPLEGVELQLTAANDGQYFRPHSDTGSDELTARRAFSCVYFFHREPSGFAGGELRLFDSWECGEQRWPADSFQVVPPVSNRLVVFPSDQYHEVMNVRCPSRDFADGRFAITSWILRASAPDAERRFGWGHLRCGVVAPQFTAREPA